MVGNLLTAQIAEDETVLLLRVSQAIAVARTWLQAEDMDITCQPAFRDECAAPKP